MTTPLAERIRAIAVTLTPATMQQATEALLAIAVPVARIEVALDEIAADALESVNMPPPPRPMHRRPHLTLVKST